jgi:hypothetical protein
MHLLSRPSGGKWDIAADVPSSPPRRRLVDAHDGACLTDQLWPQGRDSYTGMRVSKLRGS